MQKYWIRWLTKRKAVGTIDSTFRVMISFSDKTHEQGFKITYYAECGNGEIWRFTQRLHTRSTCCHQHGNILILLCMLTSVNVQCYKYAAYDITGRRLNFTQSRCGVWMVASSASDCLRGYHILWPHRNNTTIIIARLHIIIIIQRTRSLKRLA